MVSRPAAGLLRGFDLSFAASVKFGDWNTDLSYTLDPASLIPNIVTNKCRAGKCLRSLADESPIFNLRLSE